MDGRLMVPQHVDVLIVGGGPVGAALGLALAQRETSFRVLEARPAGSAEQRRDPRALALSYNTRLILERWQAWAPVAALTTPLQQVHVSQRGGIGRTLLRAQECGVPALGYVGTYDDIAGSLRSQLIERAPTAWLSGIRVRDIAAAGHYAVLTCDTDTGEATITSRLVVLADGGGLLERVPGIQILEREYGQTAVLATVQCPAAPAHTAWERFTPDGPIALLPLRDRHAVIWTRRSDRVDAVLNLDDAAFCHALTDAFGERAGPFAAPSERQSAVLRLRAAKPITSPRIVLVGNAAHALHPVAGQGFNLGLRDAWDLAELLARRADPGGVDLLASYRARRRRDMATGIALTNGLLGLFGNSDPLIDAGRGFGLGLLDLLPPAKRWIAGRLMFGA